MKRRIFMGIISDFQAVAELNKLKKDFEAKKVYPIEIFNNTIYNCNKLDNKW